MARILEIEEIAPAFKSYIIHDPVIARRHRAGQFVIVLLHEDSERIPLTIADSDAVRGTIRLVVQEVGKTTMEMGTLHPGDDIQVVGPLGKPTHIENFGTCVCVGGGAGIAPLLPIALALEQGREQRGVDSRRSDPGAGDSPSRDGRGVGRDLLHHRRRQLRRQGPGDPRPRQIHRRDGQPKLVIAIGPAVMMRAVSEQTRPLGIPTLVSLNTIMIDGTGMCGGCRVPVGGQSRFVCVDGPEFDGHEVDFDMLMKRQRIYLEQEEFARRRFLESHECRAVAAGG